VTSQSPTAVVTGGGTGIGRAVAAQLAGSGHRVVIVGRRPEVLAGAAAGIPGAIPLAADLSKPDDVERLAEAVRTELGTLDALVLNAGGADHGPLDTVADVARHWLATVELNILSAVLTEHALRPLLRTPGGRIIVVTSSSATSAGGEVAYASSKAALNRWVRTLATTLGRDGVTVNAVAPGFVPATELYGPDGLPEAQIQKYAAGTAIRRAGTPEDIAEAIGYLVSAGAGFVTGSVFAIDGGTRTPG
jgi:3-oxoacyl-[acyl-carrier protein] reductase